MAKFSKEEVFEKVRAIIADEGDIDVDEIEMTSNLVNDMGLSSMDIMNMISAFENAFSIEISEKLLRTFVTTEDIVNCILGKI